jgi:hypothetical protein
MPGGSRQVSIVPRAVLGRRAWGKTVTRSPGRVCPVARAVLGRWRAGGRHAKPGRWVGLVPGTVDWRRRRQRARASWASGAVAGPVGRGRAGIVSGRGTTLEAVPETTSPHRGGESRDPHEYHGTGDSHAREHQYLLPWHHLRHPHLRPLGQAFMNIFQEGGKILPKLRREDYSTVPDSAAHKLDYSSSGYFAG